MIDSDTINAAIADAVDNLPYPEVTPGLYEPIRYTLESGGKHLRPTLALASCQAVCGSFEPTVNQAIAIEMFHNFTLIHDDVMDKSDMRRGRPTVFRKWNADTAILSGDTLLTMAYIQLAKNAGERLPQVLELFNNTAMEVYEGQQMDMEFEAREDVTIDEYLSMIRLKTSVLLGCAVATGALMGGAGDKVKQAFYEYGVNLGMAFQLRDDWLDTFGNPEIFGKPIGGDIINRKKTWLFLNAVKDRPLDMAKALAMENNFDIVDSVTSIYHDLGLSKKCDDLIAHYNQAAVNSLYNTGISESDAAFFLNLVDKAANREK